MNNLLIHALQIHNFLTVLLLHCKQYEGFLHHLKAAVTLMIRGKIYDGKTVCLNMLKSVVNLVHVVNALKIIALLKFI